MLIASLAFVCIKKALSYDNSAFSTGHNISDVFSSEDFFDKAPVRKSGCCSFRPMHEFRSPIQTITISPRTQLKTLYKRIKCAFGDTSDTQYELDMMASCLTHIKYRTTNPIHSVILDNESIGRICQIIGNEYFPRDHVYAVHSTNNTRYIRIKIK